jgi:hypothetical protein
MPTVLTLSGGERFFIPFLSSSLILTEDTDHMAQLDEGFPRFLSLVLKRSRNGLFDQSKGPSVMP